MLRGGHSSSSSSKGTVVKGPLGPFPAQQQQHPLEKQKCFRDKPPVDPFSIVLTLQPVQASNSRGTVTRGGVGGWRRGFMCFGQQRLLNINTLSAQALFGDCNWSMNIGSTTFWFRDDVGGGLGLS